MNAPVFRALAAALRRVLILTPTEPPLDKPVPFNVGAGMPEALAAARAGDRHDVDQIEKTYRELLGPRPMLTEEEESRGLVPLPMDVFRGAGPNGETVIEWAIVQPCPLCQRNLARRAKCRRCNGEGHVSEEWHYVYTTPDGRVLEENA